MPDMFGVVRRNGDRSRTERSGLTRAAADKLADALQAKNPNERYAVVEMVFHRWTKPPQPETPTDDQSTEETRQPR